MEERILATATVKKNLTGLVVEAGKFNSGRSKTHMEDNKEEMESLLKEYSLSGGLLDGTTAAAAAASKHEKGKNKKDNSDDGDGEEADVDDHGESEVPDDEMINELMASYLGEMELYTAWDMERARRREEEWTVMHTRNHHSHGSRGMAKIPPQPEPLMDYTEVPSWMTDECWPVKYSTLMNDMLYGAGKKKPKGKKSIGGAASGVYGSASKGTARELEEGEEMEEGEVEEEEEDTDSDGHKPGAYMVAGKIMRRRKDITYDDGMTDLQFSKFVEKEADKAEVLARNQVTLTLTLTLTP